MATPLAVIEPEGANFCSSPSKKGSTVAASPSLPPSSSSTGTADFDLLQAPLSLDHSTLLNKNNERDDLGSFDEKDSKRQAASPTVSAVFKKHPASTKTPSKSAASRKRTRSFDESAAAEEEEEEASIQIRITSSRDSTTRSSFDSTEAPLVRLENVTALSRSLIAPELQQLLQKPPLHWQSTNSKSKSHGKRFSKKMATTAGTNGNGSGTGGGGGGKKKGMFRKRLSLRRNVQEEKADHSPPPPSNQSTRRVSTQGDSRPPTKPSKRSNSRDADEEIPLEPPATPQRSNRKVDTEEDEGGRGRTGSVLQRLRTASRSRSKARMEHKAGEQTKPILVAVTSCRSDAYYNQKAPGSTSKLPRKAPSNLKLFHELAVGIKDAYAAVGQTPTRPDEETDDVKEDAALMEGKTVLWEFVGNLDFVS